jgi:2-isopropylmalate synthase
MNGVGERAGNTAMEEVVMAVKSRKDIPVYTDIETTHFHKASHAVSTLMRMPVQPNKAIVGRNAFAHSSGIHQDGVLKNRENYEIIDPADVGVNDSTIELTARSGRAALNHHFQRLGINLNKELLDQAYDKFLKLADCKQDINDSDLYIIAGVTQDKQAQKIRLKYLQVVCGKNAIPMATVKLIIDGEECTATSSGNGPVDAAFQAVRSLIHRKIKLEEYLVQAITGGTDDVGKVHIQIENKGNIYYGFSANTDIVTASVEAYVNAISKII